jgi:phosphoribosyl-AMP cyclohydrolase
MEIKYDARGLVPAVVQDADKGDVLMVGFMNEEALKRTLTSGDVWFFSRSRQELWHKGETSGNFIRTVEVWKDCDNDTILVKARPVGPVCHTGNRTCFFQKLDLQIK